MQPDAEAASWRDDSDYVTPPSSGGKQQHEAPPPARRLMNWRSFVRIQLTIHHADVQFRIHFHSAEITIVTNHDIVWGNYVPNAEARMVDLTIFLHRPSRTIHPSS